MLFLQLLIISIQLFIYTCSSVGDVDILLITISSILPVISFLISIRERNRTYLKKYNFSIILFFFIMSWIISFQIPLEVAYGNVKLLNHRFIYNVSTVNKMVAFSAAAIECFLLGVSLIYRRTSQKGFEVVVVQPNEYNTRLNLRPLLFLLFVCFSVFSLNINKDFIDGGHGSVKFDGLSFSFFTLFCRLSIIFISFVVFSAKQIDKQARASLFSFIRHFNKLFLICIIFCIIVFFLSHTRVFVIFIVAPLLFAAAVYTRTKIKKTTVIFVFLGLSVFATLFKIYGIDNILNNGITIDENYNISKSVFPFTAELASSVYSQSILFTKWLNDNLSLFGISYVVGLFRTIPGLMGALNIPPILYDTAVIATQISGANYGVGTTAIIDLLINFGLPLSLLILFFIGCLFSKIEASVYSNNAGVYSYVVYFSICSFILFIPRASMNDLVGTILFNLLVANLYRKLFLSKLNK